MASKFPEEKEEKRKLRARKGHDMTWSCDKHAEPISFYCTPHKTYVCDRCAIKEHCKKPCQLMDIEDVILETRRQLDDLQAVIEKTKRRLRALDSNLESSATSSSNHLQSVGDEVHATYDGKLKKVSDKETEKIRLINEEADEEIRIINDRREERIKACKDEAEKQQQISRDILAKLLSEIKDIDMMVRKKMEDLKSKNKYAIETMDNMDSKITRIKQDDQTLVYEAPHVIASLDKSLSSNVHGEVADYLDRIEREVQRVRFVEGEVGGEPYEKIDGYIGKWELVKSIDIPLIVDRPLVCGLKSDDEICMLDDSDNALHVTNISTEHTEEVMQGESKMNVTSCSPLDSNVIVCGKWRGGYRGDSLDGCITLYDRQWKVIRDINIPRNKSSPSNIVFVDVDRDGMILAAQYSQSNIYVINPADGKIVSTITMQDKKVYYRLQALSSGDIIVQTDRKMFTVISRSGEEKAAVHCDKWEWSLCYVDRLTDTLYITCQDKERKFSSVDQVSCDGDIQARRIVEYKQSDRYPYISPCPVTPSGNLVACDGDKLFVYKKSFIV